MLSFFRKYCRRRFRWHELSYGSIYLLQRHIFILIIIIFFALQILCSFTSIKSITYILFLCEFSFVKKKHFFYKTLVGFCISTRYDRFISFLMVDTLIINYLIFDEYPLWLENYPEILNCWPMRRFHLQERRLIKFFGFKATIDNTQTPSICLPLEHY